MGALGPRPLGPPLNRGLFRPQLINIKLLNGGKNYQKNKATSFSQKVGFQYLKTSLILDQFDLCLNNFLFIAKLGLKVRETRLGCFDVTAI